MELTDLLRQGESETLEFKASFSDEALESIGALTNALGGIVLVGVEDDGAICGVKIGKRTLEDWANRIQEVTDPRLQPSITKLEQEGKAVVAIHVEPAAGAPVSVRGRYFRRVGRTNQRMSHEEIMQWRGLCWNRSRRLWPGFGNAYRPGS
jgi:ATP-dependent DNA helicase RecG